MAPYTRPLPIMDADSRPYWEGTKAHELRAQKCNQCGAFRWLPRGVCPDCHSWSATWVRLPETGTVATYVVMHLPMGAFAAEVPYIIARIAIDGTRGRVVITSHLLDCPWEEAKVGMPVKVVFDDV